MGDELTHVNGVSVVDATHTEVIQLIADAGAQGEVVLGLRCKMPLPISGHTQVPRMDDQDSKPHPGAREVIIDRPNMQTSFGFVLQSNKLRTGYMICELLHILLVLLIFFFSSSPPSFFFLLFFSSLFLLFSLLLPLSLSRSSNRRLSSGEVWPAIPL